MSSRLAQATSPHPDPLPKGEATKRRRRRWMIFYLCFFFAAAYFTYTPIISSLIAHELTSAVDARLHAELKYDSLTYIFPYQVRLTNVRLQTDPTLGEENLLTIEKLDLRLAQLPR